MRAHPQGPAETYSEFQMRVFVGNLPYSATSEDVRGFFENNGCEVTGVKLVTDRETGRSRGFGFVEVADGDNIRGVVDGLNGKDLNGRALTINEARERPQGGGGDRGGRGGYGDRGDRGDRGGRGGYGGRDRGDRGGRGGY